MAKRNAVITIEEMRKNAIAEMENCMAYLALGQLHKADLCCGAASVWEEMLSDFGDVYLPDEDEHYNRMTEIWAEDVKNRA